MFNLDTFRLIKKTFNRFFTIVMIVLIGVAFMMGLMSCEYVMQKSVDSYYDAYNLQDLQLYSAYGFDDNDILAIKEQEGIKDVFASKMIDSYARIGEKDGIVVRLREYISDVNRFKLIAGHMPFNDSQVLLLKGTSGSNSYQIGDKIELYSDDGFADQLRVSTFTIVGFVESPEYLAKFAGTSNLDNLDIDLVLYGNNTNFIADYYTTVYLTLADSLPYLGFSKAYDEHILNYKEDLTSFAAKQQVYRKDKLLKTYTEKIKDGEKELAEQKQSGEEELAAAKKALDDAQIKLIASEMMISSNEETLRSNKDKLAASKALLDENAQKINDAIKEVENQSGQPFDSAYQTCESAYFTYLILETQMNEGSIINTDTYLRNMIADNNARIAEIDAEIAIIDNQLANGEGDPVDLARRRADLNAEKLNLQNTNVVLESMLAQVDPDDTKAQIQSILDQMDAQANGSVKDTYFNMKKLKEGKAQLDEGYAQLASGQQQVADGELALKEARAELARGQAQYKQGLSDYQEGLLTFNKEIEKAENKIRMAYQELNELPEAQWLVLDRSMQYSSTMFKSNSQQMGAIGISIPLLFYLVAALVCMTTMTRLVDEQRSQIGVYCALGFSKSQIIGKYCLYGFLACLGGSLIGIPLGYLIFPTVIYSTWRLMYNLPPMVLALSWKTLLICVFAFSALVVFVTFLVVNNSLKEMPASLMRPKAPKEAKKIFLENWHFLWKRLSFTGKITARNLVRYKMRFFMTVFGVAGCTSLLVIGFGVRDSISDVVNIQYGELFNYNHNIALNNDDELEDILNILENDFSNDVVAPYMTYTSKAYIGQDEPTMTVQVLDARAANSVMNLRSAHGQDKIKLSNNGVVVSQKFAKNNNLKEGDTLTIESAGGIKASVQVDAICEWYFQHYIFIADTYYESTFAEKIHENAIAVKCDDGLALKESLKTQTTVRSVTDFSSFIEQFNTMISALNFIIAVIILTAGSLAFVVLINLTQVNISERMREIATLKVLGFRDSEVNSYLFKEIILLTIIGGILGLPLGYVEERMIMSIINMDMIMFGTHIKLYSYLFAFAITLIFTFIVLMQTRRPLRKIAMVESLKSVE